MKILQRLLSPVQNCEEIVLCLCRTLAIPVTRKTLLNAVWEHPDYPSLLAVGDVMRNFGVENVSLRIKDPDNLIKIPLPFMLQVKAKKSNNRLFAIVYGITDEKVDWYNPETHKRETISFGQFETDFTGYVQIYEKTAHTGEKGYAALHKKEKTTDLINLLLIFFVPLLTLLISAITLINNGMSALLPVLYTLIVLAGAVTGALLVFYEVDQHNPSLRKVCSGGLKTSCAAVLHSKGSTIFNIHWSVIGFSYFMGVLAVLLAAGIYHPSFLSVAAWLNVLALPYTVYSIVYQALIVRKWCPMCLAVQVVLVLLFMVSLLDGSLSSGVFSVSSLLPFVVSIGFVFLAVYLLLPTLEKAKTAGYHLRNLQRMKHNPQIFEALLEKQKQVAESTRDLGITLANPNKRCKLIKVCNPYCEPCAQAHPIIDGLLKNNPEIELQIIFLVTERDTDYKNKPVKTLLALSRNATNEQIADALDAWYLQPDKNYERFEKLYPFGKDVLDAQVPAIKKMREWCEEMEVTATPTFFINNRQLPEMYSVADLQYFLSV